MEIKKALSGIALYSRSNKLPGGPWCLVLVLDALRSQILQHSLQAPLVDGAYAICAYTQGDVTIFFGQIETLSLQIGQETTLRAIIRMAYIITYNRFFTGYFALTCHS